MANPTHLKQTTTGRVYPFTQRLRKRSDMVPYEPPKRGEDQAHSGAQADQKSDDISIILDGESKPLSEASRGMIAEFAERHYDEKMDKRRARDAMAADLKALIDEFGAPEGTTE